MANITYKEFLRELSRQTPYDFCDYSENSIQRRIHRILQESGLNLSQLLVRATSDTGFVEHLVNDITVNTTELFRNQEVWEYLFTKALPKLNSKSNINIWHAGCSTGQEVYSNLILLNEHNMLDKVNIVASDINNQVVKTAKTGEYPFQFNAEYVETYNRLMRKIKPQAKPFEYYFDIDKKMDVMKVKGLIGNVPTFVKHNLVAEEIPFHQKFDIIFCRNVLIYFNPELQFKIVRKFFDRLFDGGMLILGSHETLHGFVKSNFVKDGMVYTKSNTFHLTYK